jgi:low temperature requirement protein LtrA
MVFLWLRAARQDTSRRRANLTYAVTIGVAQIGWVALVPAQLSLSGFLAIGSVILLLELAGPLLAERRKGGTPWHAGHIAERFGLLTIITLGEGVIGTVASLSAVVDAQGWSRDAVLVVVAGIGLTFGIWWTYFSVPSAEILRVRRERALLWGYLHIFVFGSIAAVGAGLHVAALYIGHEAHIGATATVLTVAVPVMVYALALLAFYTYLVRAVDPLHLMLLAGMIVVVVLAVVLAAAGVPMAVCLVVLMCAPIVSIVGYETVGHRHLDALLTTVLAEDRRQLRGGSVI